MKLLFDEYLARRLVHDLADVSRTFSRSTLAERQTKSCGTELARMGSFLSPKNEDFQRMSVMLGPAPKVVWIRRGYCATAEIVQLLRSHAEAIEAFVGHLEASFLEIG